MAKKNSAEQRVLRIPCVADRVAQSAATSVLQEILEPEFEPCSYAYRPGRSVDQAVAAVRALQAQGYGFTVEADIRAYFDNVPHDALLRVLGDYVPEARFLALVEQWLDLAAVPGKGLPQGAPISPILANLYLDRLDEAMAAAGLRMVRYADDFVILCTDRAQARRALHRVASLIKSLHLELHPDKTAIRAIGENFAFLGRSFGGKPSTLARQIADLSEESVAREAELPPAPPKPAPPVLDGRMEVQGSRRIGGLEFGPDKTPAVRDAQALDQPWTYAVEGDEVPDAPVDKPSRHAPFIKPLYIREKGRRIDCVNGAFGIFEKDDLIATVAPDDVDRIDLYPGIDISTEALRRAALGGIAVFLCDGRGITQGTMLPEQSPRSRLHLAQARLALDEALTLDLARRFVAGKIYNARRLLQRRHKAEVKAGTALLPKLNAVIAQLDDLAKRAAEAPTMATTNAVRGIEGAAAKLYWPMLAALLKRGWAEAHFKRSRMPPKSAFNALLNWTSNLLRRDIETLVSRHGLHPGFGVLHSVADTRNGCVFDLMEEFRAPIAEALAAQLLSTPTLNKSHFAHFGEGKEAAVWLVNGAAAKTIREYERFVDRKEMNSATGEKTSWRGLMDYQMTRYIDHVMGGAPYASYRMDL